MTTTNNTATETVTKEAITASAALAILASPTLRVLIHSDDLPGAAGPADWAAIRGMADGRKDLGPVMLRVHGQQYRVITG